MTKLKLAGAGVLVAGLVLAFVMTVVHSPAKAMNPALTYDYKVETINERKDLEAVLKENGRKGWRFRRMKLMKGFHDKILVILEKPSTGP